MVVAELLVKLGVDVSGLESGLSGASVTIKQAADGMVTAGAGLTAGLTAPIVGVATAALASALKVGALADELLDLVDQTGLSTDALQEFRHVALVAGVAPDTLANAAIKLTTALQGSGEQTKQLAGALGQLGISATDSSGGLVSMDALLPDIIAGLQGMSDTTQRNILAADIFGRSWAELAPVLGLGADGMADARQEARDLGLVLSGEALQSADDFRVGIETLRSRFDAFANTVGVGVIKLGELPTPVLAGAGAIAGLLAAMGPVVAMAGFMLTSWTKLVAAAPALRAAIALVGGATGIGLAIVAFGAVVAGVTAVVQHWDILSFEAKALAELVGEQFSRLTDAVGSQIDRLLGIFDKVKAGTEKVIGFFQNMFDVVVGHSIVPDMIQAVKVEFGRLDTVMAGAAQKAVVTTNAAFANIVNPEALRAMDFNVTMDADQLYAGVIRGGGVAEGALKNLGGGLLDVLTKFTPMGLAVEVIGDLMKELEPALDAVAPIVTVLAKALAAGIMPILKLLFPVIKFLAVAFTVLLEIVYKVAQGWLFIIGHVVKTIGKLIDALPFVSGEGIIRAGENLLNTSKEMGAAADSMSDVRDEIRALTWPDEAQEAANQQLKAAMDAAAESWRLQGITNETLGEIRDAIRDQDMSPVINVTSGGSGVLTSGATPVGGTLTQLDQALGIMGIRRNTLLTGDNSI